MSSALFALPIIYEAMAVPIILESIGRLFGF